MGRIFGTRRHPAPTVTEADIDAVDVDNMVAVARERGDLRSDDEVLAALVIGADFMAERHRQEAMRVRAAAASTALSRRLVASVGEDQAAVLVASSEGPINAAGAMSLPPR